VSRADAEDLVQEVMAILVQRLPEFQYDQSRSFRGWLRTITVNRRRDFFRRRGIRPHTTGNGQVDLDAPDGADALAEEEYSRYLVSRALELMQSQFEAATWRACWECVVNERPAEEVAAELGVTVNAVYIAKSRVLRRLRCDLDGLLD
jgi:RNA polymerase sigma-70 factor (ECF subfamily)